ncbi:MAG TPA: hypothetical protein VFX76_06155, partial [Roseiflexaceae bacterium]|nr:hypothetical protein [Roseiflexaceae bacterium]
LALGTLAIADAFITTWDSKSRYVYWRPMTAIREGDNDGNPQTLGLRVFVAHDPVIIANGSGRKKTWRPPLASTSL